MNVRVTGVLMRTRRMSTSVDPRVGQLVTTTGPKRGVGIQAHKRTKSPRLQEDLTTRDTRLSHTTTGLALWSGRTLETRSHPWVPAGHPQYTGAHHDGKAVDGPKPTTNDKQTTAHSNNKPLISSRILRVKANTSEIFRDFALVFAFFCMFLHFSLFFIFVHFSFFNFFLFFIFSFFFFFHCLIFSFFPSFFSLFSVFILSFFILFFILSFFYFFYFSSFFFLPFFRFFPFFFFSFHFSFF